MNILLDCIIVLVAVGITIVLALVLDGPWLFLPAALGIFWLTVLVLRKVDSSSPQASGPDTPQRRGST